MNGYQGYKRVFEGGKVVYYPLVDGQWGKEFKIDNGDRSMTREYYEMFPEDES